MLISPDDFLWALNPNHLQFTTMSNKRKHQILPSNELEPAYFWYCGLEMTETITELSKKIVAFFCQLINWPIFAALLLHYLFTATHSATYLLFSMVNVASWTQLYCYFS